MNHNRNSIRALRTTGVGWYAHRNIPDLALAAGADFTLLLWVVTGDDLDGELYAQEGGFALRLTGGVVSFTRAGFGHLAVSADWRLARHTRTLVAVRRKGAELTLFVGGLPAARAAVTDAAACEGDFAIGRQFMGGFAALQVSRRALEDGEILAANAVMPAPDADCVFCGDCESAQYKDVSANHLPLWAEGEGAGCGVFTACTRFNGWRQCACEPGSALPAAHTLLVKLWPQPPGHGQTRCRVYEARQEDQLLYALELEPQENNTFRLLLVGGAGELAFSKTLLPQLWQDAAVVFDGARASLYLDGAAAGGGAFPCAGGRTRLLAGAPEGDAPEVGRSFEGYLAYTAEFDSALTAQQIAAYADDPPFLYAPGLVSLLLLDWNGAPEGMNGVPLAWIGGSGFCLAADITPRTTPIGVSVRLPEAVSPQWEAMSDLDRWCLEQVERCAQLFCSGLAGLPATAADGPPRAAYAPEVVRRNFKGARQYIRSESPAPTARGAAELEPLLTYRGSEGAAITLQGPPAAGAATETATYGLFGAAVSFVQQHPVACSVAAAAVVLGGVAAALEEGERERPDDKEQPTDLSLLGICWCDGGSPEKGGIYFHQGGVNKPASMDWPLAESCAVLVPGRLTSPAVSVRVQLPAAAKTAWTGELKLWDISAEKRLGDAVSATFTVQPGETRTVPVPYSAAGLQGLGFVRHDHVWQICAGGSRANAKATLYLLPAAPAAPWQLGVGAAYDPAAPAYVDTALLDFFLPQGGQPADWRQWMTRRLNASGFVYDSERGACHYCNFAVHTLRLQALLADLPGQGKALNCADCAHIVCAGCALVGQMVYIHQFVSPASMGFNCNQIIAIGDDGWHYPFESSGQRGFSYHMFNVTTAAIAADTRIYDACLQVDGGPWPGSESGAVSKTPLLPLDMPPLRDRRLAGERAGGRGLHQKLLPGAAGGHRLGVRLCLRPGLPGGRVPGGGPGGAAAARRPAGAPGCPGAGAGGPAGRGRRPAPGGLDAPPCGGGLPGGGRALPPLGLHPGGGRLPGGALGLRKRAAGAGAAGRAGRRLHPSGPPPGRRGGRDGGGGVRGDRRGHRALLPPRPGVRGVGARPGRGPAAGPGTGPTGAGSGGVKPPRRGRKKVKRRSRALRFFTWMAYPGRKARKTAYKRGPAPGPLSVSGSKGQLVRGQPVAGAHRPQHPAGHAGGHHPRGDGPGDHAARADHRPPADGHTAADHRVCADPHVLLQGDGGAGADALAALGRVDGVARAGEAHPRRDEGPRPDLHG